MEKIFKEILDIKNGKNQKAVENPDGKYPIYGSGGIMSYADQYICEANTVIIGRKGNINNPIYVETPFWNVDTAFGLVAKSEMLLPKYLYYFCENYNFKKLNTTVTIPSLTKANLLKVKMNLPELEQQKKEAEILDKVNQLMELRNKQLADLDDLIKSRFVEMFGDPMSNPMRWNSKTLDYICTKITDGEHASVRRVEEGKMFLNARNVTKDNKLDLNNVTFVCDEDHQRIFKRCNPEKGDILITTTGTIGNLAIVPDNFEVSMDRGITLLKIDFEQINSFYIFWLLQSEFLKMQMRKNIHGSALAHLYLNKVRNLQIIIPPLETQAHFADFVQQVDKLKVEVQKSLNKTQMLFDSLMQKYFE
jgi:type I restriction enzyme S subunit